MIGFPLIFRGSALSVLWETLFIDTVEYKLLTRVFMLNLPAGTGAPRPAHKPAIFNMAWLSERSTVAACLAASGNKVFVRDVTFLWAVAMCHPT